MTNNNIKILNPGSPESIQYGCTCPVIENNMGMFPPLEGQQWWCAPDCILHGDGRLIYEFSTNEVNERSLRS